MVFLKNTLRFILLSVFVLITLWLFILLLIYFSLNINKIKSYSKVFIEKNTNLELDFDTVALNFFPTINLSYSNISLKTKNKKDEVFKSANVKIVFNLYNFFLGKFLINVFIEDAYYFLTKHKIDFSNIPYTYASFLFFSKYNIHIKSLNLQSEGNNFLKIISDIHIDPLKQEAYSNSLIKYLNYNLNLNTKFLLSNKNIFESFIFTLNTIDLNNKYVFNGIIKKELNNFIIDKFNILLNNENIKFKEYDLQINDDFKLFLKTENKLNKNLFTILNILEKYLIIEEDIFYKLSLILRLDTNNVYFNGEILFNNVKIQNKAKAMNIEKLLVIFNYIDNKLLVSMQGFNKDSLVFKETF